MSKRKLEEPTLNHIQQLEECFDTKSEHYLKMMKIINTSDENKDFIHKHHIVPRSYFAHKGWKTDNSDENIACLTPYEHCLVHYYAWKCANKIIKRSMCNAIRMMSQYANKGFSDYERIAFDYSKAIEETRSTPKMITERLQRLGSTFICKSVDHINRKAVFHCQNCGFEKTVNLSYHKCETACCKCSSKFIKDRKYKGKYGLIMFIGKDKHAYYATFEVPRNRINAYTWDKLMTHASRYVMSCGESILKWKLIGATDKKYSFPYICPYSKEQIENFMYFAKFGRRMLHAIYDPFSLQDMEKYAKYYGVEIPQQFYERAPSSVQGEYYCEELDEWHTIKDWEEILGYTWVTITRKYTMSREMTDKEAMKYLMELYQKDPSIIDRIEEEFSKWY